jgi:ornithine cyclodeaminase/alanine dehydrogenase-like protein (mu-crystallin family)
LQVQRFRFSTNDVLLLHAGDVSRLLDMDTCVAAVEAVFRRLAEGSAPAPGVLSFRADEGHFHLKAGLSGDGFFVAKVNANYPGNGGRGLPTIQGVIGLSDAGDGRVLAVLDSGELTARRTGAATGVAVKHLAVRRPLAVTLCGCGRQAVSQLAAVAAVRPIELANVCDRNPDAAQRLAAELCDQIPIEPFDVNELAERARVSDVVITCTPARQAILGEDDVSPGCLIAAVGADNPEKQELDPKLLRRSKVVVDVLEQCAVMGDLHHALAAGVMTRDDVYGELGDIVSGNKAGRSNDQEIIVFDSTGMALQDAAAAVAVWRRATSEA